LICQNQSVRVQAVGVVARFIHLLRMESPVYETGRQMWSCCSTTCIPTIIASEMAMSNLVIRDTLHPLNVLSERNLVVENAAILRGFPWLDYTE
jgi:hypothetical protein